QSSYAADFLGSANLIAPDSTVVDGEVAYCAIGGEKVRVHSNGCSGKEAVKLCIREESLRLLSAAQDAQAQSNLLKARVERIVFMGEAFRIELRLANGVPLKLLQPNGFDAFVPAAGADVRVQLSPDSCLVRD